MTVLSVHELRDRIDTPAGDFALTSLLASIEAEIVAYIGPPYVDADTTISEEFRYAGRFIYLKRRVLTIDSVTEYTLISSGWDAGTARTEGQDYLVWPDQGRLERRGAWGTRTVVAYVPQDDRAAWKEAELDLARIALSRSALKQESVGGEYSFTAPPDWEVEKQRVLGRLSFLGLY